MVATYVILANYIISSPTNFMYITYVLFFLQMINIGTALKFIHNSGGFRIIIYSSIMS